MPENNESDASIRIGIPIHAEHLPLILAQVTAPLLQANQLLGQPLFSLHYLAPGTDALPPLPLPEMTGLAQPTAGLDLRLCPAAADAPTAPVSLAAPGPASATPAEDTGGERRWPLPLGTPGEALQSTLQLIECVEDDILAHRVARALGQIYQGMDRQAEPTALPPRLQQALALMDTHLEEPLSTEQIAQLTHLSRRHLERLFRRHLDTVPARYYLQLRLQRARELLCNTQRSIIQIGLECGFSSGPHFSSAYKNHFQLTPRDERQNAINK
ncbi:helix-turn-helix domain-containing protein [Pseudaeromonas paramecii]|uniref:HTH araC/xylS-type domain-containing protein n=1 Tax=Pseudaeromonas paramecii TaxID=2138166 RepID=A0ABP8QJA0_9GAMM